MKIIINKSLLVGDTFMPEMHLRQPGFTYSACSPFTKNRKQEIQTLFIKMNSIRLAFSMICPMVKQKI